MRSRITLHALPALAVAVLALTLPLLAAGDDPQKVGAAGSVTTRAANEGGPGGDQRYPIGSQAIENARNVAIAYWGKTPCNGEYVIEWTPLDMGTNATASWRNRTDAWNNPDGNFDCRVDINPQADYDYAKLCTVMTHEIGHLLGQQHDPNPGQLMSAYYTSAISQCETGEPAGSTTPAPAAVTQPASSTSTRPKRTLKKRTTTAKTKRVRRCVLRYKAGKRVKRCFTVRVKVTTKKRKTVLKGAKTAKVKSAAAVAIS